MLSQKTVSQLLTQLAIDPFIGRVAEELLPIAAKHGDPMLPSGPRAEIGNPNVPLRTVETIGDWGGDEADMAARYNAGLVQLLAVLDMHHAGADDWVMTHPSGDISDAFKAFSEEAFPVIERFVTDTAWDAFLAVYI